MLAGSEIWDRRMSCSFCFVLNDWHHVCLHSENICGVEEGKARLRRLHRDGLGLHSGFPLPLSLIFLHSVEVRRGPRECLKSCSWAHSVPPFSFLYLAMNSGGSESLLA